MSGIDPKPAEATELELQPVLPKKKKRKLPKGRKQRRKSESDSDDLASTDSLTDGSFSDDEYDDEDDEEGDGVDMRFSKQVRPWFWVTVLIILIALLAVVLFFAAVLAASSSPSVAPAQMVIAQPTPAVGEASSEDTKKAPATTLAPSPAKPDVPPDGKVTSTPPPTKSAPTKKPPPHKLGPIIVLPGLDDIPDVILQIEAAIKKLCDRFPVSDLQPNKCLPSILFREFGADNGAELKAKLMHSLVRSRTFTFVLAGASSTAGADVQPTQTSTAWLTQELHEILGKVLKLNVSVVNVASQGSQSQPLSYCLETYIPSNADVITYDWPTFGEVESNQEAFIRAAAMHPAQPVVFFTRMFQGPNNVATFWSDFYYGAPADAKKEAFAALPKKGPSKLCMGAKTIDEYVENCLSEKYFENDTYSAMHDVITRILNLPEVTKLRKFDVKLGELAPDAPIVAANPVTDVNHSSACFDSICKMSYYYRGMYATNEFNLGHYFDFLPFYFERSNLLRASHHPGSLAHLLQVDSYVYFIYKTLIHALRELDVALQTRNSDMLKRLADPPRRAIPKANWNGQFPHDRGGWCSLAFRPLYGPDLALRNLTPIATDPSHNWSYVVLHSGKQIPPEMDQKNRWETGPQPSQTAVAPLCFRFNITKIPASILLLGPRFEDNDNLRDFGTFSIDQQPDQHFTANLTHIADGFFVRMWGKNTGGHNMWAVGDVPGDFNLDVGEHVIALRPSTNTSVGSHRLAGILVL